jgi:Ca2+-binding EF-hand superfamily protein
MIYENVVKDAAAKLFLESDFDGSGALSREEIKFIFEQLFRVCRKQRRISESEINLIMRRMDKNSDEEISLEEFIAFFDEHEEDAEEEKPPEPCCSCYPFK